MIEPCWPKDIKKTKQRLAVYEVLKQAGQPISASDIYEQLLKKEESYAFSTIYRILTLFEEHKMVEKTTIAGEENALYQWNEGGHKHYAICLACHQFIPLKECPFEHMAMKTKDEEFTITGHKIELYGYCKECKRKQEP